MEVNEPSDLRFQGVRPYHSRYCASPAPGARITKAQTEAEARLAAWNRTPGIRKMPAIRAMTARMGPKKRPRNTAQGPKRWKKSSPRTISLGLRDKGQTP